MLWVFVGLFGAFEGPMWPAMQSILTEDYGFELQALHMAVVLCFAKLGIFSCQILFSWLLANGDYFNSNPPYNCTNFRS